MLVLGSTADRCQIKSDENRKPVVAPSICEITMIALPVQHLQLPKALTGITGLDEITEGGLPKGRPTLVAGGGRLRQDLAEFGVSGERRYAF